MENKENFNSLSKLYDKLDKLEKENYFSRQIIKKILHIEEIKER